MIDPRRILYRDEHLLIVNKLAGELVVAAGESHRKPSFAPLRGASAGKKLSLFDFLRKDYPGLRVAHRLDFGTSGILVFACSAEALRRIRETKFEGWKKTYRALVAGKMKREEGTIRVPLKARTHEGLVEAVTHYRTLETFPLASFVEAQIETGRKHQIRQHFASLGHPLLLDPLYGEKKADAAFQRKFRYRRFFLHAFSLAFPHPITGEAISLEAPLPPAFEEVLERVRREA